MKILSNPTYSAEGNDYHTLVSFKDKEIYFISKTIPTEQEYLEFEKALNNKFK